VPRDLTPDQAEQFRKRVEDSLNALSEEGEREFDRLWEEAGAGLRGEGKGVRPRNSSEGQINP
jgi:hypothetical protein